MAKRKSRGRHSDSKPLRRVIVIATEGKDTERRYFDALNKKMPETNIKRVPRPSNRTQPIQVLDDLICFKKNRGTKYAQGTPYWLIVDWDGRESSEIEAVAGKAKENGCRLADSNPCFEVWLFQHYSSLRKIKGLAGDAVEGGCSRIIRELKKKKYDPNYDKSKYDVLKYLGCLDAAVINASGDDFESDDERMTLAHSRVYKLVESIINSST